MRAADALRRGAWWLALAGALAGCADGYPQDDAPHVSPFDMDNGERIAALNQIARGAHPDRRWMYAMERTCELGVEYRRKGSSATRSAWPLVRATEPVVVFDKADQTYGVVLRESADRDAPTVTTVLEASKWTDATQAELLLRLVIRDCARERRAL